MIFIYLDIRVGIFTMVRKYIKYNTDEIVELKHLNFISLINRVMRTTLSHFSKSLQEVVKPD